MCDFAVMACGSECCRRTPWQQFPLAFRSHPQHTMKGRRPAVSASPLKVTTLCIKETLRSADARSFQVIKTGSIILLRAKPDPGSAGSCHVSALRQRTLVPRLHV